jgi:hypothetical protein
MRKVPWTATILTMSAIAASLAPTLVASAATAALLPVTLSVAQARAEFATVGAATAAAMATGWRQHLAGSEQAGHGAGTVQDVVVDPVTGRQEGFAAMRGWPSSHQVFAQGQGQWTDIDRTQKQNRRALALLGRPTASFTFAASAASLDQSLSGEMSAMAALDPADLATLVGQSTPITPTIDSVARTDVGDGTRVYTVADHIVDTTLTATLSLDVAGRLVKSIVRETAPPGDGIPGTSTYTVDYTYGPVTVRLPTGAQTVPQTAFDRAVYCLTLPTVVASEAKDIASDANTRALSTGHKSVGAADIRVSGARRRAQDTKQAQLIPVRISVTSAGVSVSATNPFTHQQPACAVLVIKGRAAVRRTQ